MGKYFFNYVVFGNKGIKYISPFVTLKTIKYKILVLFWKFERLEVKKTKNIIIILIGSQHNFKTQWRASIKKGIKKVPKVSKSTTNVKTI